MSIRIVIIPLRQTAVHLPENFEERDSIHKCQPVNGVINLVKILSVQDDGVIVIRKFAYEGSRRRNNDFVFIVAIDDVEDTILVVVGLVGIGVTLNESEAIGQGIAAFARVEFNAMALFWAARVALFRAMIRFCSSISRLLALMAR